jgi:hypothetical protein
MAKAVNTFLEFLGFVVSGTQRNNGAHSAFNIRLPVLASENMSHSATGQLLL